jgi:hypothetical protein
MLGLMLQPGCLFSQNEGLLFELGYIFFGYQNIGDPFDGFGNRLFMDGFDRDFHRAFRLPHGVLKHGCGQAAVFNRFDAVRRGVDAEDHDIVFTGSLQGIDGAESHFIVIGKDGVDFIAVGGDPVFDDGNGFFPLPVGCFLGQDFDVGIFISDDVLDTLGALE